MIIHSGQKLVNTLAPVNLESVVSRIDLER